jgi:hypothetical protein
MVTAETLIDSFDLKRHPEGGHYRRTYESSEILQSGGSAESPIRIGSAILYLLRAGEVSKLHRIRSDEMWHFYCGSPLNLHEFTSDNNYRSILLGNKLDSEQVPQYIIKSGNWFGATVEKDFALVGCTLWPEFRFEDFELAEREPMMERFPSKRELIDRLT